MDQDSLRALQRHNELSQFLDYERRLRAAYARSQDPHPRRAIPASGFKWVNGPGAFVGVVSSMHHLVEPKILQLATVLAQSSIKPLSYPKLKPLLTSGHGKKVNQPRN